jgi:hypothetical protein
MDSGWVVVVAAPVTEVIVIGQSGYAREKDHRAQAEKVAAGWHAQCQPLGWADVDEFI